MNRKRVKKQTAKVLLLHRSHKLALGCYLRMLTCCKILIIIKYLCK